MSKEEFYEKYFNKEQIDLVIGILEFSGLAQEKITKNAEGIDDEFIKELVKHNQEGSILNRNSLNFYINLRKTLYGA